MDNMSVMSFIAKMHVSIELCVNMGYKEGCLFHIIAISDRFVKEKKKWYINSFALRIKLMSFGLFPFYLDDL